MGFYATDWSCATDSVSRAMRTKNSSDLLHSTPFGRAAYTRDHLRSEAGANCLLICNRLSLILSKLDALKSASRSRAGSCFFKKPDESIEYIG